MMSVPRCISRLRVLGFFFMLTAMCVVLVRNLSFQYLALVRPLEVGRQAVQRVGQNVRHGGNMEHWLKLAPPWIRNRKHILFWTSFWGEMSAWNLLFSDLRNRRCPRSDCNLLLNKYRDYAVADAVVFHVVDLHHFNYQLPSYRPPGQIWILFCLESPRYWNIRKVDFQRLNGVFNWTMTYRTDSDVFVPYGLVVPRRGRLSEAEWRRRLPDRVQRIYPRSAQVHHFNVSAARERDIAGKSRLVMWMASNCASMSGRQRYVSHLSKYITVDVFGRCGVFKCGSSETVRQQRTGENTPCNDIIRRYKFYLAFENAFCPDYVTEKLFRTLALGVVPVVLGGVSYSRVAPEGSYIDAGRMSPQRLASYLHYLDKNHTAYREFFRWRERYEVLDAHPRSPLTCGLCDQLHRLKRGQYVGSYDHMDEWFSPAQCSDRPAAT